MSEFDPQSKLLLHSGKVQDFIDGNWMSAPVQVEISPTNSCNAKCDWCFYVSSTYKQHHSQEEIDVEKLEHTLVDLSSMGAKAVTWTGGGDPSVYSHIDRVIDKAASLGLRQGIFTNGYKPLKSPEKLDWIRITVTEKFVITKHVAEYAKKTKTGVNFNLCKENLGQLIPMAIKARESGVSYFQVRPALADRYDLQEVINLPIELLDLATPDFRIVTTGYKWGDYLKPHGYPKCYGHQLVPFLWHNGDVSVCAYHFGKPDFTFGNLSTMSFKEIWYSDKRREMVQQGVDVIPACQHCCKLHEVNKSLAALDMVTDKEFL